MGFNTEYRKNNPLSYDAIEESDKYQLRDTDALVDASFCIEGLVHYPPSETNKYDKYGKWCIYALQGNHFIKFYMRGSWERNQRFQAMKDHIASSAQIIHNQTIQERSGKSNGKSFTYLELWDSDGSVCLCGQDWSS